MNGHFCTFHADPEKSGYRLVQDCKGQWYVIPVARWCMNEFIHFNSGLENEDFEDCSGWQGTLDLGLCKVLSPEHITFHGYKEN